MRDGNRVSKLTSAVLYALFFLLLLMMGLRDMAAAQADSSLAAPSWQVTDFSEEQRVDSDQSRLALTPYFAGEIYSSTLVTPHPLVQYALNRVQSETLYAYVGGLSGEWPVMISGQPYTISTRDSYSGEPISQATRYVYEHLQDLGLQVGFQTYTWEGNRWRNVVAEQQGSREPERIFLITAHIDDMPPGEVAPGADDNATGVSGVLVVADILSRYDMGSTLRYVLFTGEEQGLHGSDAYATAVFSQEEHVEGVLNLDMIGYNSDLFPGIDLYARSDVSGSLEIAQAFSQVVDLYDLSLEPELFVDHWLGNYSDNKSFWDRGYPAILAIEDDEDFTPHYHTIRDRLDTLDMRYFTEFVRAAVGTLAHMAGLPALTTLDGHVYDGTSVGRLEGATVAARAEALWFTSTTSLEGGYQIHLVLQRDFERASICPK